MDGGERTAAGCEPASLTALNTSTATSKLLSGGSGSGAGEVPGGTDEQEIYSLLVLRQSTFEGLELE